LYVVGWQGHQLESKKKNKISHRQWQVGKSEFQHAEQLNPTGVHQSNSSLKLLSMASI
jgi:N-acetyl-anhydromuramyl-L-alanine amidase AmpD